MQKTNKINDSKYFKKEEIIKNETVINNNPIDNDIIIKIPSFIIKILMKFLIFLYKEFDFF